MRRQILAVVFLAICPLLFAQQALNNDSIIKLVKAGLSDDLIVTTINTQTGAYDTSADGLSALKIAGASDKVIAAIIVKAANPLMVRPAATAPVPPPQAAAVNAEAAPIVRDTRPRMQLSFCKFQLWGPETTFTASGMAIAGLSVAGEMNAANYYGSISNEVKQYYKTAIEEDSRYQIVDGEKLVDSEDGKHLSLADMAQRNNLFACVSAKPQWAVKVGWDKKLAIQTKWEVESPGGCKVKFNTSVASFETYGKFPHGTDPKLKSAYLGLSKEDARQFIDELQKAMKKAGCER
jgi:hypothetical protein